MPATDLVVDLFIRYGFQVLGALVILVIGTIVARWTGRLLDRRLQMQAMEPPMRLLLVRAVRILVLLFAAVVALDKFGFQVAPLVAGIGVAGLGVGLAMQGVLSNVVAGLTIIMTKPFRVGQHIEMLGVSGTVSTIELFSTTLVHPDHSELVIPNRKIVGEILHNFGTTRQLRLTVTVPHHADLERVLAVAREVVTANARVLKDPSPIVGIAQLAELGIRVSVMPWVRVPDVGPVEAELNLALVESFRAAGLSMAVPSHEIRLLDGVPVTTLGR